MEPKRNKIVEVSRTDMSRCHTCSSRLRMEYSRPSDHNLLLQRFTVFALTGMSRTPASTVSRLRNAPAPSAPALEHPLYCVGRKVAIQRAGECPALGPTACFSYPLMRQCGCGTAEWALALPPLKSRHSLHTAHGIRRGDGAAVGRPNQHPAYCHSRKSFKLGHFSEILGR
jgi:hypothetical protein